MRSMRIPRTSTFAENSRKARQSSSARLRKRGSTISLAKTSWGPDSMLSSTFTAALAPTFAARKRGYPRIKPPYFPAVLGLYMCPTIVNNVETLCNIKHILAMGGAEYARLGRPNNTGTRVLCVSGDVQRPGYFEVEVGAVTMGQLIHQRAGGLRPGRKLKAVSR